MKMKRLKKVRMASTLMKLVCLEIQVCTPTKFATLKASVGIDNYMPSTDSQARCTDLLVSVRRAVLSGTHHRRNTQS